MKLNGINMSSQVINETTASTQIHPANQGIANIAPYQTGKPIDELKRELGLDHIVKLASNENPLGCSALATKAVRDELVDVGRYPDGSGYQLKQKIVEVFHVEMAQVTLGNGSNDILELVARTFVSPTDTVVYSQHAFAIYALATQAVGATGIEVPAKSFGHDLVAMAQAVREDTRVVFLANPNNPTGTWFAESDFETFMQKVPAHVLVVLDEAYVEYFPEYFNSLKFLKKYSNLLISRTFSKAYGLASLRVGFALASPQITDLINRVRQPFNVNSFALAAATASLGDQDFLNQTRTLNHAGMAQLEAGCTALGLSWIPSRANFLSICVNNDIERQGAKVFQDLLKLGVIVRSIAGYGMPEYIRVSIGTFTENKRFLEALSQVLQAAELK
jgi:histidinol-phosphate aminotransferase